jgi:hypothetical protein
MIILAHDKRLQKFHDFHFVTYSYRFSILMFFYIILHNSYIYQQNAIIMIVHCF